METEELTKLVDGIYKNILDKFNPGARQMINAGKAYLKALHGAAAASRLYVDAISKLARQAQQGTWGGSSDIGTALMRIVEVYKDIQEQQMNILKAFYVDMLVPLETNLEKDTKVVQSEQKRFLQQHKARSESYSKAAAAIKKQRKKTRAAAGNKAALAIDKELKNMQVLEEEKSKLDAFCEQSLKNAMTQERRRYGFVLERQCSLAKHYLSYHTNGMTIYQHNIDDWNEVAKTREFLPDAVESMFTSRMRQVSFWPDDETYCNPRSPQLDDDRLSITSQLRKTKSMDASCLDIRSIGDASSPMLSLSRAKSDFNLNSSNNSLVQDCATPQRRPKSMAISNQQTNWGETQLARALYAYLSSGDNQLSFLEGDVITLMGERNKGWQFGENLRTQCSGWFPLAYTEILLDDAVLSPTHRNSEGQSSGAATPATHGSSNGSGATTTTVNSSSSNTNNSGNNSERTENTNQTSTRMFGDTLNLHRSMANAKQIRRVTGMNSSNHHHVPPPSLPAPVPTPTLPFPKSSTTSISHSQSTSFSPNSYGQPVGLGVMKSSNSSFNFSTPPATGTYSTHPQAVRNQTERGPTNAATIPLANQTKTAKIGPAVGNVSLHSSNDSGFSNDPPPQPEVDYSDDDVQVSNTNRIPIRNGSTLPNRPQNDKNNNKNQNRQRNTPQNNTMQTNRSNSYGTLLEHSSDYDQQLLRSMRLTTNEKKGIIKRTKSFWRFGRSCDNDILEGMALWRHRDLVDIQNEKNLEKSHETSFDRHSGGSNRSHDSDRTLQNSKNDSSIYMSQTEVVKKTSENNGDNLRKNKKGKKDAENRKEVKREEISTDSDFENHFDDVPNTNGSFFDDDGLMLRVKTVNRKNILQQYNEENCTDSETESREGDTDSILTSDDPYDCIVVDDHTATSENKSKKDRENKEKPTNKVVEIGKKLEKLAKSSKYSPDEANNNIVIRDSNRNIEGENRKSSESRTFQTFGHEDKSKSTLDNRKNIGENRKDKYFHERENGKIERDDDKKNFGGESLENRQIIPRTKLVKSNSVGNSNGYNSDISLLDYGQSLQKKMKNPDMKYQKISMESGNMYGPWYDLWGSDSSVKTPQKSKRSQARQEKAYKEKF